ncbi:hypothetical protein GCM10009557_91530 [Virgisporangium ochraceum]|uniref:Ricin B lectin domain-containing protein n=1 Tax=Virgisporangium ochraceum TaxID=65505 RepID=A0A8J3ZWC2_9ACTN|nr:RICIN domain-containing protein [Virgisporangium ochraceum]GIJ71569.1 hypothetical protein Voc01_064860 [Virgisporangium ochraceum]
MRIRAIATALVSLVAVAISPSPARAGAPHPLVWGVNQPASGSIIKIWNGHAPHRCLDADTGTMGADGTRVQLWDCNGEPQQRWLVFSYPVTGAIGLVSMHPPHRVLDVDVHSNGANSGYVHLWTYNGALQQQWNRSGAARHPDSLQTSLAPNRCLDADVHTMYRLGTIVHMWDCNGQPQQRWFWANV